ncbi:MAG: hypothetical protein QM704_04515 [Anaeromyxobacteraceae bacterium]
MQEQEAWTVRPSGEARDERPVRVLDGDSFTLAAPAEVRKPRFLQVAPRPKHGSARAR